ncbi:MAG: AMP-binding protein, partial [Oscillospiraceae bacterium]|nr:AMP-binding protein [Oscillospiraceae bacterium]
MGISAQAPWYKFYGSMPKHLDYPRKTLYQIVRQTARAHPELTAYEFMNKKTSYEQFMQRIDRTARALTALGIGQGDRVTICMPNCPQALDMFYALNRIGAVSNMIHPLSAPTEIAFYLNFSHSKAILTLDQFYPKLEEIRAQLEAPVKVIVAFIKDELPAPLNLLYPMSKAARKIPKLPKGGDYILWNEFLRGGKKARTLPSEDVIQSKDGASILYSGGTT